MDLNVGTGGYGAVYICPALGSDTSTLVYTTGSWTGSSSTPLIPWATNGSIGATAATYNPGWAGANHNGPYSCNTFAQAVTGSSSAVYAQGKIVSTGVRIQYVGTTLNESGIYTCYHDPGHANLSGFSGVQISNFSDCDVKAIDRNPCHLTVHAVDDDETHYANPTAQTAAGNISLQYPFSSGTSAWAVAGNVVGGNIVNPIGSLNVFVGAPIAIVTYSGVAGSTIHLEFIQHMEISGGAAAPLHTPNEADITGVKVVQTAALQLQAAKLAQPKRSTWSHMFDALSAAAKVARPIMVPMAEAALTSLLA